MYKARGKLKIAVSILSVVIYAFWGIFSIAFIGNYVYKKVCYPLSEYKDVIIETADRYSLDRALVFSIIKSESKFNAKAVSNKGAMGLMQLTKSTADYVASLCGYVEYDVFNPKDNVNLGCFYLNLLINKFMVVKTAICAYNAGEGNVSNWLNDKKYSQDGYNLEKIPFAETANYLHRIEKSLGKYKKLYKYILDKPN